MNQHCENMLGSGRSDNICQDQRKDSAGEQQDSVLAAQSAAGFLGLVQAFLYMLHLRGRQLKVLFQRFLDHPELSRDFVLLRYCKSTVVAARICSFSCPGIEVALLKGSNAFFGLATLEAGSSAKSLRSHHLLCVAPR